jgi:hypothetical protein
MLSVASLRSMLNFLVNYYSFKNSSYDLDFKSTFSGASGILKISSCAISLSKLAWNG